MIEERKKPCFAGLQELLISHYNQDVFSAASIAFSHPLIDGLGNCLVNCGTTGEKKGDPVNQSTMFDLASLTKPLVTLLCVLSLIEKKKISWDEPLDSLLCCRVPRPLNKINLFSLLCHSSGLPAHRNYWQDGLLCGKKDRKVWLKEKILQELPEYEIGKTNIYSDLGYMLLGFVVEEKAKKNLANYWYEKIADPLGIRKELNFPIFPAGKNKEKYVTTGSCNWSQATLKGIVHDDNSRALGGIYGHAGLFGSVSAVLLLCQELLCLMKEKKTRLPISAETFRKACLPVGKSEWTTGFNMPSGYGSSSGRYFSKESIGHLGFTGTSFWIDPNKELIVVFLTNRVIKGDDQRAIKKLRPKVHNFIVEGLRHKR